MLVCKMAIFALLGVYPFSYLPHLLENVEENKAMKATQGGFSFFKKFSCVVCFVAMSKYLIYTHYMIDNFNLTVLLT